jgi:glycosyltransferase involved in cell wall biosynthesis
MDITQIICNLRSGGAERLAVDLSCALANAGHRVRFVMTDRRTGEAGESSKWDQLAACGIEVQSLNRVPGTGILGLMQATYGFASLLRTHPCDVIHSHLPYAHSIAVAARRLHQASARQILTVHTSQETWQGWQEKLIGSQPIAYCSRVALRRSNHANTGVWVVPNGVPLTSFATPRPERDPLADLAIPPQRRRIISVGSLLEGKNYRTSLEAIGQLSYQHDVHFLVCGAGNAASLEAVARRIGVWDRVAFLGPRPDVPSLLASSDLFLSASRYEGMPIAVLEALASGLPCVLSPIEEHEEVAASMAGCLIAEENTPSPLTEACHKLLETPLDRLKLQAARAAKLGGFSISNCADRYLNIYHELVSRGNDATRSK